MSGLLWPGVIYESRSFPQVQPSLGKSHGKILGHKFPFSSSWIKPGIDYSEGLFEYFS